MQDQEELTASIAGDVDLWKHALTPAARRLADAAEEVDERTALAADSEGLATALGTALWFGPIAFAAPWLVWVAAWRALLGSCSFSSPRPGRRAGAAGEDVRRSLPGGP